eukprot:8100875-Lingulodinium_polyedra.AAC.1
MVPTEPGKVWLLVGVARGWACKAGVPSIGAGSGGGKASVLVFLPEVFLIQPISLSTFSALGCVLPHL